MSTLIPQTSIDSNHPNYQPAICALYNEYQDSHSGCLYGIEEASMEAKKEIINSGFIGSQNIVNLKCEKNMLLYAPGCIAAPRIMLISRATINIGLHENILDNSLNTHQITPFRLFAPTYVAMAATEIIFDHVLLMTKPKDGQLICDKLTLKKTPGDDPEHFELVKSWIKNDFTEIEVIVEEPLSIRTTDQKAPEPQFNEPSDSTTP